MKFRSFVLPAVGVLFLAITSFAQTSSLEGDVKGEDGQPLKGALVKIERKDIKGNYKVKTDKKGHYFHAGLPLGTYKLTVEVDGKDVDSVDNVRTRLGDPQPVNFDLQAAEAEQRGHAEGRRIGHAHQRAGAGNDARAARGHGKGHERTLRGHDEEQGTERRVQRGHGRP